MSKDVKDTEAQEELKDIIQKKVWEKWPDYYVVIDVDTAYVY